MEESKQQAADDAALDGPMLRRLTALLRHMTEHRAVGSSSSCANARKCKPNAAGEEPEKDHYTLHFPADGQELTGLRIEVPLLPPSGC